MSRSSVPFNMPSYHIQLKSTDRRSLAPGAGVYGAPAFGSAFRPRPPPPPPGPCASPRPTAGACCALPVDAAPTVTTTARAIVVQPFLRKLMPILCLLTTEIAGQSLHGSDPTGEHALPGGRGQEPILTGAAGVTNLAPNRRLGLASWCTELRGFAPTGRRG